MHAMTTHPTGSARSICRVLSVLLVTALAVVATSAVATAATDDAKPEVTAIFVQPLHDAQVVRGDDGMDHVEYDLLVVSVLDAPVTLSSVTVLALHGKELGTVDGNTLAAATQELFSHKAVPAIPASGAVAVEIDVAMKAGTVPARLTNRIAYTIPADAVSAPLVAATEVDGPEVEVDRDAPFVIKQPPLEGDGWLATSACCEPNPHTDLRLAIDGLRIDTGERFAIDWGQVKDGRIYEGDGSINEQHHAFGANIVAIADGTVAFVHDGEPEETPGTSKLATRAEAIGGNKVILEVGPKVYAAYEHLQPGSLTVKVGDKVEAGTVLAKLGNSGPSTGAHLHFGLLDRPDIFTGRSLPFVFDRYTLAGTVDLATAEGDALVVEPEDREIRKAYPLWGSIQNFG
jgi:murein DD-endopeptidase MepM/ murein hydrolase activator NlpD